MPISWVGAAFPGTRSRLGLLPQAFHLFDGALACGSAPVSQFLFDISKPAPEFRIGFAQRLLGIYFDESRQIDQDKEEVAKLIFHLMVRSARAGLVEFSQFLAQLVEHLAGIFPIESYLCSPAGDLLRFDQRGQRAWDRLQ